MKAKALVAEFIGTFTLIFVGVGSIIQAGTAGNLLAVALAHGVAIAVMASATCAISGGHLNPAVTFGAWVGGRVSLGTMIAYWISQVAGGVVAAYLIHVSMNVNGVGTPALAASTGQWAGFLLEAIGTFFLVFVVYGTAIDKRGPQVGALFVGLTITISILCFGPLTGCAINPGSPRERPFE